MTALLFTMLTLLGGRTAEPTDSCATMLPASLRQVMKSQYPGHRLPQESDSNPDYVSLDRQRGGSGCIAAAQGDFNLDGRQDVAFLATSADKILLMVALSAAKGWDVEEVWRVGDAALRSEMYVAASKPGKYGDSAPAAGTEVAEGPSFTCDAEVLIAGMGESTAVAFCRTSNRWLNVWVPS